MKTLLRRSLLLVCVLTCSCLMTAHAQSSGGSSQAYGTDRLFLAFVEDGVITPAQWWEGQLLVADIDPVDVTVARLVFALQPYEDMELGGRVGFGSSDAPAALPDGSGATDLDLWGKWHLGSTGANKETDVAVGSLVTVPTGDDAAGLGTDSFGLALFGAVRHHLAQAVFSAHAGLRFNEDGQVSGFRLEGKTSGLVGVGVIVPLADQISVVGEANLESERFEDTDSAFSLLGGVNWRMSNRGVFRAALALGVTDGAPDAQFLAGYAFLF